MDPEDAWWQERWKVLLKIYGNLFSDKKKNWKTFRDECFLKMEDIKFRMKEGKDRKEYPHVFDNDSLVSNYGEESNKSIPEEISKYICLNHNGN